jgi:hypothetical protein
MSLTVDVGDLDDLDTIADERLAKAVIASRGPYDRIRLQLAACFNTSPQTVVRIRKTRDGSQTAVSCQPSQCASFGHGFTVAAADTRKDMHTGHTD